MNQVSSIVLPIDPNNKALRFIDERISRDNYRGHWSSQHNRYTMDKLRTTLKLLNRYAPNKDLMKIRTTDISKRPKNNNDELQYANFCNDVKRVTKIGTQDAMRKNLFPDWHRMSFIERYDANRDLIDPLNSNKQKVQYVAISERGLKLIKNSDRLDQYYIYSKGINRLLQGYIDVLFNLLEHYEDHLDYISIYEFMFFLDVKIDGKESLSLIEEYRKLSEKKRDKVINTLTKKLHPQRFIGNKLVKRDFGNWKNKVQQIFYLLDQTIYFNTPSNDKLTLNQGKSINKPTMKRSPKQKTEYFEQHNIKKEFGFELHHVVPFSWAESDKDRKLLDHWKNMTYIDGTSHNKITQQGNDYIIMCANKNNIVLKKEDNSDHQTLIYKENIKYNTKHKQTMLDHNKKVCRQIVT
ncbi:hypothetical protein COTS27_00954 [Spirochaetota bacterium]|nr:hypothetical protein COTS27_00954 [Spirochaetota bacterium]